MATCLTRGSTLCHTEPADLNSYHISYVAPPSKLRLKYCFVSVFILPNIECVAPMHLWQQGLITAASKTCKNLGPSQWLAVTTPGRFWQLSTSALFTHTRTDTSTHSHRQRRVISARYCVRPGPAAPACIG